MQEAVSGILSDRAREADGLSRMLVLSVAAHIGLVAVVWLAPESWRASRMQTDESIMTISLGGTEGPDTGGMTSIADRAVQSIAKPDAKVADIPPAPKAPEMIEPRVVEKMAPRPAPKPVEKPAETARPRPPTAGAEIKTGSSNVKTGGAAIPFGGLAQGGGGAGGMTVDVKNFCCPEYLNLLVQRIRSTWNPKQGAAGQAVVRFTIRRDGMLTNIELTQSSGQAMLDLESRRAVHNANGRVPPLPREFTGPNLTIHLTFDYQR